MKSGPAIVITHVGASVVTRVDIALAAARLSTAELEALKETRKDITERVRDPDQEISAPARELLLRELPLQAASLWNAAALSAAHLDRAQIGSRSSAELASLAQLDLSAGDEIHLLASNTELGTFCAEIVRAQLLATSGLAAAPFSTGRRSDAIFVAEPVTLYGLEVQSTTASYNFVHDGLANYLQVVRRLYELVQARPATTLVFNVTAGFKAMVPFATLLAALLAGRPQRPIKTSLYLLFEHGLDLIKLDPLPLRYDNSVVAAHSDLFRAAHERAARSADVVAAFGSDWQEQVAGTYFVPTESIGTLQLSSLGELVWQIYDRLGRWDALDLA